MTDNLISSLQNARVKRLLLLGQKSSARRESSLFVVEGLREVGRCLESGYVLDSLYYCPSLMADVQALAPLLVSLEGRCFEVTPEVYARIAYRDSTEGVVALVEQRRQVLDSLSLGQAPLIVVLESVEKPGNLGAVLRSAG